MPRKKNFQKEKTELADISAKINNGVKFILAGNSIPELEDELSRLRVRKDELEDILQASKRSDKTVSEESIVNLFKRSIETWNDENIKNIIKSHVTKIYANTDGSFTVNVGVHINGCGGQT